MKVLLRFTWESLRKNRVRTAVTILGVILSMTLFTAVLSGASSGRTWLQENETARNGCWEGYYYGLDKDEADRAVAQDFIKDYCVWKDVGWAVFPNENDYRPYLFIQSMDEKTDEMVAIHLKWGRLPENESELLIPDTLHTLGGVKLTEGEELHLNVGKRTANGNVLTEKVPRVSDGSLPEKITEAAEKTYRVVGVYERLDFSIEGFEFPGYTALTAGSDTDIGLSTVFFTVDHPTRFYSETAADQQLSGQLRPHSDLLYLSGQMRDSGVLRVLYGMAAILVILIMIGSISLIYNSFSISISERLKSYGVLRSVGATKHQVRMTVLMESLILCGIGIPLGIGLGLLGLGGVLSYLQKDFAAVFGASLSYVPIRLVFSIPALLMAVVICLITVLISALIPAQKAIHASAIDAIRQQGMTKYCRAKGGAVSGKLFGFGGTLAGRSYVRSRRRYVITILSLALSIVLFIAAASFSDYLQSYLDTYAADHTGADIYLDGVEGVSAETVLEDIRAMKHVDECAMTEACDLQFWIPWDALTKEYRDYLGKWEHNPTYQGKTQLWGNLQFLDDDTFRTWCRELGLDPADFLDPEEPAGIVMNHVIYKFYEEEKGGTMRYSMKVLEQEKSELTWYTAGEMEGYLFESVDLTDGVHVYYLPEEAMKEIAAEDGEIVADETEYLEDHPKQLIGVSLKTGVAAEHPWMDAATSESLSIVYPMSMKDRVLPAGGAENGRFYRQYEIRAADHAAATDELFTYLEEKGITGGAYDRSAQQETARMALKILNVFLACFILLMALISIVNVYNTISTNIRLRRREFAMLRSVGMGDREFNRMMRCESLMYVSRSLVLGLGLAFLFTYAIFKVVGQNMVTSFYVPWYAVAIAVVLVVAIVFLTAGRAVRQLKGRDLAQELKIENA